MKMVDLAKKDGIRISKRGEFFEYTVYHPLCVECGGECNTAKYIRSAKYICRKCMASSKQINADNKKERMFNRAVSSMKRNIYTKRLIPEYADAIDTVQAMIINGVKFDSKEEVMVAIQLAKDKIPFQTQVEIAGHKTDFLINDLKIIIEVDGKLFHTDRHKDKKIDENVKKDLGRDWEIIRISDDNVNYNLPVLIRAIQYVLEEREQGTAQWYEDDDIIGEYMLLNRY